MLTLFFALSILYILGIWFSPFPYWPTYRILWRYLLFDRTPRLTIMARVRQARLLLNCIIATPFYTLFWYLDDLLYPGHKKLHIRPVFIIGEPRSGTTLLHRTLGADTDNFFAIRHIEWRYPFIFMQKLIEVFGLEEGLKQKSYWPDNQVGCEARRMHPNTLYDFEEDGIFYEERFLHHFFMFLRFPYPALLSYLDDYPSLPKAVQRQILDAHQKVIQKVMYLRGGGSLQFLSKEVTSHNKIPHLLERYPDARFVLIIRPASEFMDSLMALVRNSTTVKNGVDPLDIPGWKEAFIERMRKDSDYLAALCEKIIPRNRQVRVKFSEFTKDIPGGVRYIYQQIGETPGDTYLCHLKGLESSQKRRDRGYTYSTGTVSGFERFDRLAATVWAPAKEPNKDQDGRWCTNSLWDGQRSRGLEMEKPS